MKEERNELMTIEDSGIKGQLVSTSDQFCSFVPNTPEERKMLFKAMNTPEKRLSEMINMEISIKDIYSEMVEIVDSNTGETVTAPRIVLIDVNGIGYQCVSKCVFNAIKKLISVFGMPTWHEGITVTVKQITKGTGQNVRNLLTFDM